VPFSPQVKRKPSNRRFPNCYFSVDLDLKISEVKP
jgi:hypothetical protein